MIQNGQLIITKQNAQKETKTAEITKNELKLETQRVTMRPNIQEKQTGRDAKRCKMTTNRYSTTKMKC